MKGFDFKTFDFRKKIIGLDEETLALFLETRIKDLNIESKWRAGLKEFILQQWDVKSYHPSYEKVYNYLQNHDATELEFKTLDITALFPLIHYYRAIDGSERMYNLTSDSEIEYLTKNQIMDLHSIRNLIEHEVQNLDPDREKRMYLLQLWATERIAGLALLVMTCRDPNEEWKQIYQRAKSIEHDLRGERWLVTSEVKSRSIPKDANMSDILSLAEQGNAEAQLMVGKAYRFGDRVDCDYDRAFYWFRKAARAGMKEAEYYMGIYFRDAFPGEYDFEISWHWFKLSAEHGYAPAQCECGKRYFGLINPDEKTKEESLYWINLAAQQDYPEALWLLGLCYETGYGINKDADKGLKLKQRASTLGYTFATKDFAWKAEKQGDFEEAIRLYRLAQEQEEDESESNHIGQTIKRIERILKREQGATEV